MSLEPGRGSLRAPRAHSGLLPAVALAAAVIVVTAVGLFTGASWQVADPLGTGLPLGTLATAVSMVLLPALSLPWAVDRWTRGAAWTLAVAAAPGWWWPVTVALPLLAPVDAADRGCAGGNAALAPR